MVSVVRVKVNNEAQLAVVLSEREALALLQITNFSSGLWKHDYELEDGQRDARDYIEGTSKAVWAALGEALPDFNAEDVFNLVKHP